MTIRIIVSPSAHSSSSGLLYIVGLAEFHEKLNDQITGDAKQVGQANFAQIRDKIISELHMRFHTTSLWMLCQTHGKKGLYSAGWESAISPSWPHLRHQRLSILECLSVLWPLSGKWLQNEPYMIRTFLAHPVHDLWHASLRSVHLCFL